MNKYLIWAGVVVAIIAVVFTVAHIAPEFQLPFLGVATILIGIGAGSVP